MTYFGRHRILKNKITGCDYDFVVNKIIKNLDKKIIFAPVATHPLILSFFDKSYFKILEKIDFILPDSFYVKLSLNFLYKIKLKSRIYGPVLFERILEKLNKNEINTIFIGNNLDILEKRIKKRFNNLKIIKKIDLKGIQIQEKILLKINNKLKQIKKSIVFIGIGSPNQHILAVNLKINCPIVCVGAAFDFFSGKEKQASLWLGENGFEWLYRLLNNPKKLWFRYIILGPIFLFLIIIQKISLLIGKLIKSS